MNDVRVDIGGRATPLFVRINGTEPTFTIGTDKILAATLVQPEAVCLDLLDIACAIFATDGTQTRGGTTRPDMGADWRRQFEFQIPVRLPDLWSRPHVNDALVAAVDFLMEDSASFRFVQRRDPPGDQNWFDFDQETDGFQADEVVLFSGGLDSFAGALERLESTSENLIFVTHRSAQKTIPHQVNLSKWLSDRFGRRILHIHVPAHRVGQEAKETTQRSRSFLFAAVAQVVAQMFGAKRITFFENGIISHNLPFSDQVIGAMATRTTHPRSLHLIDALHQCILPTAATIQNPYAWLTKTEVVQRIAQCDGTDAIRHSVSCTSVRDQDTLITHCSRCSQCIDRRFAMLAAGLEQYDPSEMYRFDVLTGERHTDRGRTLAVDWTRHARELAASDFRTFTGRFAQDVSRISEGYPEENPADIMRKVFALHQRHAASTMRVLENAYKIYADALAQQTVPSSSLLVQHMVAPEKGLELQPAAAVTFGMAAHALALGGGDLNDLETGPCLPLRATFFQEGGSYGVDIRDITTVRGKKAHVVHVLRHYLDEDHAKQTPAAGARFVASGDIAADVRTTKENVRQLVWRCKSDVSEAWFALTDEPLPDDALIQRGSRGYRLSPDLKTSDR